ncbi:multiple epidermal growth factor-like domains protein 10 [Biomphalaria glabrata]|uniref:Multiple epidermal growth factor-like domains protein 10 n=1 Tax=Biomphalaria glabrata TaxID=6526 RepID=A0A9W2YGT8_BIOGL|nr:multiple epidermal growth factor-like domains protein 10 [Biomphalaria glabrata]
MSVFSISCWILFSGITLLSLTSKTSGCSPGKYGEYCNKTCESFCVQSLCDSKTGHCLACNPGYKGSTCTQACGMSTYGVNCSQTCSDKCINKACFHVNGDCNYCIAGYQGKHCDTVCNKGTYGQNCTKLCPSTCPDKNCQPTNGQCLFCPPGYDGTKCEDFCPVNTFGENCTGLCSSQCRPFETNQTTCHHVTGACFLGCEEGYTGYQCNDEVDTSRFLLNTGLLINLLFLLFLSVFLLAFWFTWSRKHRGSNLRKQSTVTDNNLYNKMSFNRKVSDPSYAAFQIQETETNPDVPNVDEDRQSIYMNTTESALQHSNPEEAALTNENAENHVDEGVYANYMVSGKENS